MGEGRDEGWGECPIVAANKLADSKAMTSRAFRYCSSLIL